MKLIRQANSAAIIVEDGAATGAGAVAGVGMPLFASIIKREPAKPAKAKLEKPIKKKGLGLREAFEDGISPSAQPDTPNGKAVDFDSAGLIAKLRGLERHEETDNQDTVTFGLEDENGDLVRVVIRDEEAKEFENALQSFLAKRDDEDENVPEIAEILFKLKDQFSIIDVVWPDVVEDEEQEVDVAAGEEGAMPNEDVNLDAVDDAGAVDTQPADILQQVIDMMKADAEARKAEARAREAEAKTKEADHIVQQSMSRVKQEEQFLDMESHQKSLKDQDREAKRLAQLARWKQEMSSEHGIADEPELTPTPKAQENEESGRSKLRPAPKSTMRGRVHPHDIASFLLSRVK